MSPLAMDLPSPRTVVCNDISFTFPSHFPLVSEVYTSIPAVATQILSKKPLSRCDHPSCSRSETGFYLRKSASLRSMGTSPRIKVYFLIQYLLQNKGFCQMPDQSKAAAYSEASTTGGEWKCGQGRHKLLGSILTPVPSSNI